MRSETSFLGVSRLQVVATTTTSAAGRDHHAERTALVLSIRFDAEWVLKHFMIAKAINCPRKRGNSNLPDGKGSEIIEYLTTVSPETYCVVATAFDDDEHLFSALKAGAKGYLLKAQTAEEFTQSL